MQRFPGLLVLALLSAACTAVVTPPAAVDDAVTVFVLREARHIGLVLPAAQPPGYVEFGFGDFDWYALQDDGPSNVDATVLWPTPGTLVRRPWPVQQNASLLQLAWFCELMPLVVDRTAARRLETQLQQQFASAREGPLLHASSALQFVPWDRGYWLLHNCNDAVVDWLRQLGCSASWVPVCLGVEVRPQ